MSWWRWWWCCVWLKVRHCRSLNVNELTIRMCPQDHVNVNWWSHEASYQKNLWSSPSFCFTKGERGRREGRETERRAEQTGECVMLHLIWKLTHLYLSYFILTFGFCSFITFAMYYKFSLLTNTVTIIITYQLSFLILDQFISPTVSLSVEDQQSVDVGWHMYKLPLWCFKCFVPINIKLPWLNLGLIISIGGPQWHPALMFV